MRPKHILIGALLLLAALLIAGCSPAPAPTVAATPCPAAPPCPECPTPPTPAPCPEPVVKDVPFEAAWAGSPHADKEAEAFVHWNEDDPAQIPETCATCHSTPGYQDFLGADGSAAGTVDAPAAIGTTVECAACHNAATATLTSVTFPSGAVVDGLGPEARCMVCHQGRASTVQVDAAIENNGLTDNLDATNPELGFINIHYFAAAATLYGNRTSGGYQYAGKAYDGKNDHVAGYNTCVGCHNQHTLELKVDECAACHDGVASVEDIRNIRMAGSLVDYDGDGDTEEGIAAEIEGLQGMLLQAIQAYANEVSGTAIAYNVASHPYFFIDTDGNGTADEAEVNADNRYNAWTGRLLKAAYNYQTSLKDPGAFAHGGKYIIQLLYDSIEDLNSVIASPVDLSTANRIDAGHFAGSEEAFRHWDAEEEEPFVVANSCAKCHSAQGLPFLIEHGVSIKQPAANGLNCATCHNDLGEFTRFTFNEVTFPSGATLTFGEGEDSNLCINCHQGRESTTSVNAVIGRAGVGDDEVSETLTFRNVHYFAAGATLFGTDAKGAYEYEGQTYLGQFTHGNQGPANCVGCHDVHALTVKAEESCSNCHNVVQSEADLEKIRISAEDFDGDGDVAEGLAGEIETLEEALYTQLQAYAADTVGTPVVYNSARHPYFFIDANADGASDEGDVDRYATWTPRLLRAAYNYQYVQKDPGTFAHNGKYIIQILIDSLDDLGADTSAYTRP